MRNGSVFYHIFHTNPTPITAWGSPEDPYAAPANTPNPGVFALLISFFQAVRSASIAASILLNLSLV